MTPEQLAEIEARAAAATPAPWYDQITDDGHLRVTVHPEAVNGICGFGDMEDTDGQDHYNAAFIAKAREDVPALLGEVKRLQEVLRDKIPCSVSNPDFATDLEMIAQVLTEIGYNVTAKDLRDKAQAIRAALGEAAQ